MNTNDTEDVQHLMLINNASKWFQETADRKRIVNSHTRRDFPFETNIYMTGIGLLLKFTLAIATSEKHLQNRVARIICKERCWNIRGIDLAKDLG